MLQVSLKAKEKITGLRIENNFLLAHVPPCGHPEAPGHFYLLSFSPGSEQASSYSHMEGSIVLGL